MFEILVYKEKENKSFLKLSLILEEIYTKIYPIYFK